MKPEIIVPYELEYQNRDLKKANERLSNSKSFTDLSTVILVPTRGGRSLCPRFVNAIMGLMKPMNQQVFGPVFLSGMEVGDAFNSGIEMIQAHPHLSKFKYLLTVEDDNIPPPDGLLKLYESIGEYDVVGGLYWTKGPDGQPMIYGNPNITPLNFVPQAVKENEVQHCNGLGMGFNLYKLSIFTKLEKPWFKTENSWDPQNGTRCYTQDLWAYERMAKLGFKVASDNRVKVGHLDVETGHLW